MTPNLIELIVQAVKDAASSNYDGYIQIYESDLRDALASIPEMPHVDLGEVIIGLRKFGRHKDNCDKCWSMNKMPCSCGLENLIEHFKKQRS